MPCKNYSTAEEFAQLVAQDLTRAIVNDFPAPSKGAANDENNLLHELYSQQKTRLYVARSTFINALGMKTFPTIKIHSLTCFCRSICWNIAQFAFLSNRTPRKWKIFTVIQLDQNSSEFESCGPQQR
jgi:hypothetical protein